MSHATKKLQRDGAWRPRSIHVAATNCRRMALRSLAAFCTALTALIASPAQARLDVSGNRGSNGTSSSVGRHLEAMTPTAAMTPEQIYDAKTAVTHDELMAQLDLSGSSSTGSGSGIAASGCFFASDGDDVHTSAYSGVLYASGHGYWWNYTCPIGYRADVTIFLEEKLGATWYPQGNAVTGYNRAPGSGSSQRVTNKMACVNTTSHQWRSIIVADIVGHADTAPAAYTATRTLACY